MQTKASQITDLIWDYPIPQGLNCFSHQLKRTGKKKQGRK